MPLVDFKCIQDDFETLEREIIREKEMRERRGRGRRDKKRDDQLDPMDPSSYSDIPRFTIFFIIIVSRVSARG